MFGLDSKLIAQVVADVAEIKAKLQEVSDKLDKLLKSDNQTVIDPTDKP